MNNNEKIITLLCAATIGLTAVQAWSQANAEQWPPPAEQEPPAQSPRELPPPAEREAPVQPPREFSPPAEEESPQISNQQLVMAARAYIDVNQIHGELQASAAQVEDEQMLEQLIESASERMEAAVRDAGLTVGQYEEILTVADRDMEVRNAFIREIQTQQQATAERPAADDAPEDAFPPQEEPPEETFPPREEPPEEPAPVERPSEPEVSDEQLARAAKAYQEVNAIQNRLQGDAQRVEDPSEIEQMIERAQSEMEEAVAEAGLQIIDYERILEAVNEDEATRAAFVRKLNERRQPRAPQEAPVELGREDIAMAAEIHSKINDLNQQLQQKLEGVNDPEEIRGRVAATERAMRRIVIEAGLEVQEYSEIMQAIQEDEELLRMFIELRQLQ